MDIATIDRQYEQLQTQSRETISKLQTLADKLRAANLAGHPDAREWMLDLKEITLAVREEQDQVSGLLQAIHGFVMRQAEQVAPSPPSPWSGQPQAPTSGIPGGYYSQPQAAEVGGMFGNFLNSGFGRAAAAGAGFGIGDTVISRLFGGRGGC